MKLFFTAIGLLCFSFVLTAQTYITTPVNGFSYKKTAYITLKNGDEIEGQLKGVKRKKGLFERITIKTANGEKTKIDASDIASMYLPQNTLDKIATGMDKVFDVDTYDETNVDVNMDKLKDGYAFFETSLTQIRKNKEEVVLLQLLNPASSSKIKIYFDPYAKETMSVGVGGMNMAGGDAKSYFVKKGEEKAFRLKKKDYDDEFATLFGDCKKFSKKIKKPRWTDLGEHVFSYTNECE